MPRQALIGTDLDQIAQSNFKLSAWKVLLFDPYQDSLSDIVLDRHAQAPIDITPYIETLSVTTSHDHDSNQCSITVAAAEIIDWRLLMFSWIKVYEGDLRVDQDRWPVVFSGLFKGQPARAKQRGSLVKFTHTAYDRSIFYRERRVTSDRVWRPEDVAGTDIGEICVELATNADWGMALQRDEVLFGQLGFTINKKLQIVDEPPMDALRTLMEPVQYEPSFNGEGKLVAKPVDLDKVPIRVHTNGELLAQVDIPQNNLDLPTAVVVRGLDFRLSEVTKPKQTILRVGPSTVGFFNDRYVEIIPYSDDGSFRVHLDTLAYNVKIEGPLLWPLLEILGVGVDVSLIAVDDFSVRTEIYLRGAELALILVVAGLLAYLGLKLLGDALGQEFWPIGFIFDALATILLFAILEVLRAIGKVSFEVRGVPFELVYREIEAKALLSDTPSEEEKEEEVESFILGTLTQCADLARSLLRRAVAQTAQRTVTVSSDPLLEPNDVIELLEDAETVHFYTLEIAKTFQRGSHTAYTLTCFRCL